MDNFLNDDMDTNLGSYSDEDTSMNEKSSYVFDENMFSEETPVWFATQQFHRQRRDGIVDECCKRSCSYAQILRYCPPLRN